MVAALALDVPRVGILDFDQHQGNGTDDIIQRLNLQSRVIHRGHPGRGDARRWLATIPATLDAFSGCAVVLYQAGADPHIDDPLGGWLTTDEMRERDRLVFEGLRQRGIPCVWNLAGGYQTPLRRVLDLHDNTMLECMAAWL